METYIEPRELVEDPFFERERLAALAALSYDMIDAPIAGLMRDINSLRYCFSLQCCYGHFVTGDRQDEHNLKRLRRGGSGEVKYRIAYICLCVENSDEGRAFLDVMRAVSASVPEYIQFCCAAWFWERRVNTYALQAEPYRYRDRDSVMLEYGEALEVQRARDRFFEEMRGSIERLIP